MVEKAINVLKKTAGEDLRIVISVRERVQEKKPICCCKEGEGGTFNLIFPKTLSECWESFKSKFGLGRQVYESKVSLGADSKKYTS